MILSADPGALCAHHFPWQTGGGLGCPAETRSAGCAVHFFHPTSNGCGSLVSAYALTVCECCLHGLATVTDFSVATLHGNNRTPVCSVFNSYCNSPKLEFLFGHRQSKCGHQEWHAQFSLPQSLQRSAFRLRSSILDDDRKLWTTGHRICIVRLSCSLATQSSAFPQDHGHGWFSKSSGRS